MSWPYRSASASTSPRYTPISAATPGFPNYDAGEWRERDRIIDQPPDPANRYPSSFVVLERVGRGPARSAAREAPLAAPHHYKDPRPAMVQSLHRSLSEADLLVT